MRRAVEPKKCTQRTLLIFFPLQIWQLKSYVISTLAGTQLYSKKGT